VKKLGVLIGILIFFAGFFSPALYAFSLEELVGAARAYQLRTEDDPITEVQLKNPQPRLLPNHGDLRRLVDEITSALDPGLFVETLYRYEKNAAAGAASAADAAAWTGAQRARLFNQTLALSTLTGIQYYSASRKTMRTFYESSKVIDGPDTKKAIPDPVYVSPPSTLTIFARQKDLTFGDNIYRYDYLTGPDSLIFVQQNLTTMNAGIIPAVGKNKLRTVMAVIDAGDSLLIYAASMAKAAAFPGLGERIGNSFTNRAEAVLKWFSGQADGVFGHT
jgi:hypothetical protein